ncbi:MAG: NAD(P)/FAD-dependent oxidoreductase [Actinomycetota bacterium]|nr:NAD(P)/FAD-dependent oxidoreductase [Actinomycetota bacterium]
MVVTETLLKYLGPADGVALIDRTPEQVIGLSLLWVMRGWQQPRAARIERPYIYDEDRVDFLETHVRSVQPLERIVTTTGGHLHYDALVVALGAELDTSIVPGLTEALDHESGGQFYTPGGAQRLFSQLSNFDGKRLAVVVTRAPYRCPAAPYEAAMLIEDLLMERRIRDRVELSLFTPEPQPMPVAGPLLGRSVVTLLDDRRVRFRPNMELLRVDAAARRLHFADGETEDYDLLVAIPPHRPPSAVSNLAEAWIPVDARTLRTKYPDVWAIGDVSAIQIPNGKFLPKAAVFASAQAEAAARSVSRYLGYDAPEPLFDGKGGCWLEVGRGEAAYGEGRFLAEPDPAITFHPPAVEHHLQKQEEQRAWLSRWRPREVGRDLADRSAR